VRRLRLIGVGLAAVLAILACALVPGVASAQKPTVTMSGSTSIYPLALQLARGYLQANPNSVRFRILQGGSDIGINDVARGRVTIGMASRDPLPNDPGRLQFNRIARDGVCIVTHPDNPIQNLSQEQIQAIFSGRVRTWSDVPGARASGAIDLVVRTAASGTQDAFQNIFLGGPRGARIASSASQRSSNGLVQSSVRSNRNAIGYVDFRFISGTNAVSFRGVACNLRNAQAGTYGGVRNFWMVTRGAPTGATAKFIKFAQSRRGQRIVGRNWVPR
jgi:phosphate transport system substrate-binding protein